MTSSNWVLSQMRSGVDFFFFMAGPYHESLCQKVVWYTCVTILTSSTEDVGPNTRTITALINSDNMYQNSQSHLFPKAAEVLYHLCDGSDGDL